MRQDCAVPISDLSVLRIVSVGRLGSRPRLRAMKDRILEAFAGVVRQVERVDYEVPSFERIEAALLTQALELEVGGHILGVTDADLFGSEGEHDGSSSMFGGKDQRNDVAIVSTRRLASIDGHLLPERLAKVALHELGHNFGLVHHYELVEVADGGCCPMSKGSYNRFGEVGYVRGVIDQRGFAFCETCQGFLSVRSAVC